MRADLPTRAVRVTGEAERRHVLSEIVDELREVSSAPRDLEEWIAGSPLFAVEFDP